MKLRIKLKKNWLIWRWMPTCSHSEEVSCISSFGGTSDGASFSSNANGEAIFSSNVNDGGTFSSNVIGGAVFSLDLSDVLGGRDSTGVWILPILSIFLSQFVPNGREEKRRERKNPPMPTAAITINHIIMPSCWYVWGIGE